MDEGKTRRLVRKNHQLAARVLADMGYKVSPPEDDEVRERALRLLFGGPEERRRYLEFLVSRRL